MASKEVARARIDSHIKEEVTSVLTSIGLFISDAIQILLACIAVDNALPFDVNRVLLDSHRKKL